MYQKNFTTEKFAFQGEYIYNKTIENDPAESDEISFCSKNVLKAHRQISRKRCFEKYCSCDKACQFSALQGTP